MLSWDELINNLVIVLLRVIILILTIVVLGIIVLLVVVILTVKHMQLCELLISDSMVSLHFPVLFLIEVLRLLLLIHWLVGGMLHVGDGADDVLASTQVGVGQVLLLRAEMASGEVLSLVDLAGLPHVEFRVEFAMSCRRVHDQCLIFTLTLVDTWVLLVPPRVRERRTALADAALFVIEFALLAGSAGRLVLVWLRSGHALEALKGADGTVGALGALLTAGGAALGSAFEGDALDGNLSLRLHLLVVQVGLVLRLPVRGDQVGLDP